jgi:hypothetical protein
MIKRFSTKVFKSILDIFLNKQLSRIFLLLVFSLFIYIPAFAGRTRWREGDGTIFLVALCIITAIILLKLYGYKLAIIYKSGKAQKVLETCEQSESIWERVSLLKFTERAFYDIQHAWMNQNMDLAYGFITTRMYHDFQHGLAYQRKAGIYNFLGEIDIKETRLVGIEDYGNNNLNKFTVYISGTMIDEIIKKGYTVRSSTPKKSFNHLYHFVRENDMWLLNKVTTNLDLWNVGELKTCKV